MAMVLDAFARYVGQLLAEVTTDEVRKMLGVSDEIDKMGDKLLDLKNFLADADRRNITDESVRTWVEQLKHAMYEATDILDLCQLKAMEHGSSSVDAGCFNPLLFCMRNPFHAYEIGTRVKALNKKLDTIKERSIALSFINLGSYEDRHSTSVHACRHANPSRETSAELDRSGVVGDKIEEDTRELVAQITRTEKEVNNNIMVVAIVGVGGIGKTTLAQKVFSDKVIQGDFIKKIWLSVNQNFSEVELLRRVIIEAGGDPRPAGNAKATLQRTLKDTLVGHKTLLVMDDVWNHRAWEDVLKIPFVNAATSSSRVLITTRDEGVARGMRATLPYRHVDTLAPDDAWSLLKKQVLSCAIDEDYINTLKDIGLKIVRKCDGLPLAIKVMGGLLREKGGLHRDWEHILDNSIWSVAKWPQELNNAVYLSYEDMPSYLKQCFLYYSLLPRSKQFHRDQIIAMWISEGFIHGNSSNLEELGRNYYDELISRNLIEPDKTFIDQSSCSMHDVVRSFAQYMTKDEALVAQDGENGILTKLSSQKFLRLSIQTNQSQSGEVNWKFLQEQQSLRTLISTVQLKIKPGDSLSMFSSLRTLHMECEDGAAFVESLSQLKHLRYLLLVDTAISALPKNIGKMKLLQFLDLYGCDKLVNLPGSILKLHQLRFLRLGNISVIPRGFCRLTNMRILVGFRAHTDGDWCSLEELGPLLQLRCLWVEELENVSAPLFASNAKLCEKIHLTELNLSCTSRSGHDGIVIKDEGVSEEEKRRIEKVFDELLPPPSIEFLNIQGYFGQQLPSWTLSTSMVSLNHLKIINLCNMAYCTQLPNGLCQLPCLQFFQVIGAPSIKRIETEFLKAVAAPFPRLTKMHLSGMVEWEEWEWEEHAQAMPRLENLQLLACKLRRFPPGLACNARALRVLSIAGAYRLSYLESFPFVVELEVYHSLELERITNLPNLKNLMITNCPKLKVLEGIPALDKFILQDYTMEKLPEYMRDLKPRNLLLMCRLWLLSSVAVGQSGTEWDKFGHVEHVKAYAGDRNNPRKWYVLYTRDNYKLDSNFTRYSVSEETLSSSMEGAQGFESVYKMKRSTFNYICSLVRVPFLEDMVARDHTITFVDGRVLSLQDGVAIALKMLKSGETPITVGSSLGVDETTASLVTHMFIEAMCKGALYHGRWPCLGEMEKIKRKFDKVHGLPNCCGVVHTTHITFGSQNSDNEENDGMLMQAVVDSNMRFTDVWLGQSGIMNKRNIVHVYKTFQQCEMGVKLNGSKLKVSSGGGLEVGEYIIGDAGGYPLRPWLLTPYQLESDLSDSDYKREFNRRHSEATDTVMMKALARWKDTWKCLQGKGWHPNNQFNAIYVCYLLHNIVLEMEEEEVACANCPEFIQALPPQGSNNKQVRQLEDEDAFTVRDALSQHMIESGVHIMAVEEEQEVASGSGDDNKEQEAFPRKKADRGKEKVHDS